VEGCIGHWWAIGIVAGGTALLGWCVREFYVAGTGTLAPWSPPKQLVTTGPFQYSRNPIYVAMLMIIAGWAVFLASRALTIYLDVMIALFHIRTLLGEEPTLAREFGPAWDAYRARVRRWL
jgi:protein-S-isoprenylcysteine O-methyltransferase Ste14